MSNGGLSGCEVDAEETYAYNVETDKWEKQEIPARCGEIRTLVPFGYDQRFCRTCAVRLGLVW